MSIDKTTLFTTLLSKSGHRVTAARLVLFKLLVDSQPLSIQQIIVKAGESIDRVSIYRNIELYETLGIIHRVTIGWKYKIELSEKFVTHHHHLICLGCGDITDIESEDQVEQFINNISKELSFKPIAHQFEIEGYCKKCQ